MNEEQKKTEEVTESQELDSAEQEQQTDKGEFGMKNNMVIMMVERVKNLPRSVKVTVGAVAVAVVLVGSAVVTYSVIDGADGAVTTEDVKETVTKEVNKKDVEVDYLKYVKGLRDWVVEKGVEVDFMTDVTYDSKYISKVTVDAKSVDLSKVGDYTITYTVVPKSTANEDLEVKKKVTVKVITTEEAKKLVEEGKEIVTSDGVVNKQERTTSSVNDSDVKVESNKTTSDSNTNSSSTGNSTSNNGSAGSGSSNASNSNSSNNNTASAPSQPSQSQHVHNFNIPITQTETVPAVTHTEDHGHYETTGHYGEVCNGCGLEITDNPTAHMKSQMLAGHYECGSYSGDVWIEDGQVWVPNIVEIVDVPASTKTVTIGYKCSCGEVQ